MWKALQLTESLRLLGAVLSLLRLTLDLLGKQPFGGAGGGGGDGARGHEPRGRRRRRGQQREKALFQRLCSLLEFMEDVREMRSAFIVAGGSRGGGGAGGGVAGGDGGGGGALFGYVPRSWEQVARQ